jgi:SAM-dependent methyltransferase
MTKNELLRKKAQGQLQSFLADCGILDFPKKKLLEIGFKNGLFLDECHKAGLEATGLEINSEYFQNVKNEFAHLNLIHYDGDKFPFSDSSFDFVVSFQVFEHVDSIEHMITQCLRVLKTGGIMYHICPNYHSFYEGHYSVFWLPFLNKKMGRLYLKLLGRYNSNFENLNIVKPKNVHRCLEKYQNQIELISLGKKEFKAKFNSEQISKVNNKFLRHMLTFLQNHPAIRNTFLSMACWCGFYYPITIILKKT